MAKEALSFPPSVFIFNNLTAHGFWQSEWYKQKDRQERARVTGELVKYMGTGQVRCISLHRILIVWAKNRTVQGAKPRNCQD